MEISGCWNVANIAAKTYKRNYANGISKGWDNRENNVVLKVWNSPKCFSGDRKQGFRPMSARTEKVANNMYKSIPESMTKQGKIHARKNKCQNNGKGSINGAQMGALNPQMKKQFRQ